MSRGATARLFVAVDPPAAVREQLAAWAREAVGARSAVRASGRRARLRLLEPESMHLTLCFLGSRPGRARSTRSPRRWSACGAAAGELSLGAPLWLPPRRPRALAVEVARRRGELAGAARGRARARSRARSTGSPSAGASART